MISVFLGFFETLGDILSGIFYSVLYPVLDTIFRLLLNIAIDLLEEIFSEIFLDLLIVLLKIVDFLKGVFDIFSGVRYVLYYPNGREVYTEVFDLTVTQNFADASGNIYKTIAANSQANFKQTYLIDLFTTEYNPLMKAFLLITMLGIAVALIFTIYQVAKSISDMALEGKNPVGVVLKRALKAAVTFALVPVMVLFLCKLSTVLVYTIEKNLGDSNTTVGSVLFLVATMGDANDTEMKAGGPNFFDDRREPYYNGQKDYTDAGTVKKDFNIKNFDFLIAFICAIAMILILVFTLFVFVKRLFEVAVLFVVSPLMVSTIPLDDGKIFGKWREAFIGRMFSGFGSVIAMKLFLLFVPLLCGNEIILSNNSQVDVILRVFIILGGAFAAYKSQESILEILSPETAQSNKALGAAVTGMAMMAVGNVAHLAGSGGKNLMNRAPGKSSQGGGQSASPSGGSQQSNEAPAEKSQAFTGK